MRARRCSRTTAARKKRGHSRRDSRDEERGGDGDDHATTAPACRSPQAERILGSGCQRRTGRVALVGFLRHRPRDHAVDRLWEAAPCPARPGRLLLEVRPGLRESRATGEDPFAGEALVEHAAERVDVRAAVDRQAFELLGREVGRRADRALLT